MILLSAKFEGFPIEFKEINPEHFLGFDVENNEEKMIIHPDDNGFINESLLASIDLNSKNTVVVNAAVGQGKSYSIIQILKKYYEATDQEYLIFVASPFVSLVEQYYKKIIEVGIPETDVYRYEYIGDNTRIPFIGKKIQIITVNGLLGNPGEDAFINSKAKRNYLNQLSDYCKENNIKVVFIYDEIHDSIHNFKEEFIFNLWKWQPVIHKNIILSATYNEASKVVIEYLAELTNKKILIIESSRVKNPRKQSKLFLHFNANKSIKNNDEQLVKLVSKKVAENKNIDILSFSKKLANEICDATDGVGRLLKDKFVNINNCTSDLNFNQKTNKLEPQNRFNNSKCNIGTNFKSGVSIEKDNHVFIIVLPTLSCKLPFANKYGIFSDGINSIIQAVARQRKKGEIHLILPPPDKFDFESLIEMDVEKKVEFIKFYKNVENIFAKDGERDLVKYHSINNQNQLLWHFYFNELKPQIENEISLVNDASRENLTRLEFPEYNLFKLSVGDEFFVNKFKFFGGDLSSYVVYASITNQFMNCTLTGVTTKNNFHFNNGKIQEQMTQFLENDFSTLYMESEDISFFDMYVLIREHFFVKNNTKVNNSPVSNYKIGFCKEILSYLYRNIFGALKYEEFYDNDGVLVDEIFDTSNYLLIQMSNAYRNISLPSYGDSSAEIDILTENYLKLFEYRQMIIDSIQTNRSVRFLKKYNENPIFSGEESNIKDVILSIKLLDSLIKNRTISFFQNVDSSTEPNELLAEKLYNLLISTIAKNSRYKPVIGHERMNYIKIEGSIFELSVSTI